MIIRFISLLCILFGLHISTSSYALRLPGADWRFCKFSCTAKKCGQSPEFSEECQERCAEKYTNLIINCQDAADSANYSEDDNLQDNEEQSDLSDSKQAVKSSNWITRMADSTFCKTACTRITCGKSAKIYNICQKKCANYPQLIQNCETARQLKEERENEELESDEEVNKSDSYKDEQDLNDEESKNDFTDRDDELEDDLDDEEDADLNEEPTTKEIRDIRSTQKRFPSTYHPSRKNTSVIYSSIPSIERSSSPSKNHPPYIPRPQVISQNNVKRTPRDDEEVERKQPGRIKKFWRSTKSTFNKGFCYTSCSRISCKNRRIREKCARACPHNVIKNCLKVGINRQNY